VREALARFGVPGERVDLYGITRGEAVLSEYAGEARLIQEPDLTEVADHDVIFLCESGEVADRIVTLAPEAAIIDLVDSVESPTPPQRFHAKIHPGIANLRSGRHFAVPHSLALLVAELLHPLDQSFGVVESVGVIIRPASDFGESGVEELREQTVRLLSFAKLPTRTFGRQLAFNIIPQKELISDPRLETRISDEVAELLGWTERRLSLRLLTAPLFYGHGLQLRVRLRNEAALEAVREQLARAGWLDPDHEGTATPLDVTADGRAILAELTEDGLGGYWLWVVSGETASRGAEQAVMLARRLSDL
jgi:aspartate-semialdehyde dehydrogenase